MIVILRYQDQAEFIFGGVGGVGLCLIKILSEIIQEDALNVPVITYSIDRY